MSWKEFAKCNDCGYFCCWPDSVIMRYDNCPKCGRKPRNKGGTLSLTWVTGKRVWAGSLFNPFKTKLLVRKPDA